MNNNNNNMMMIDLSVLQLIPIILKEMKDLKDSFELVKPNLTSQKDVMKFLEISSRTTLKNYIDNGIFQKGVHFELYDNKIFYIPEGILNFKKTGIKGKKSLTKKSDEQNELENILERLSA